MAVQRRAVVDANAVLACLTHDEMQALEELDPDRAQALVRWVLQTRWQRTRRERVADLRRMLRLHAADGRSPDGLTPPRWWESLLDGLIWWR